MNTKFGDVEPSAVDEDPESTAAADEDGLPPPVIVLLRWFSIGAAIGYNLIMELTSAQSRTYVATMVTSMTVMMHTRLTTLRKPNA